MIKELEDEKMNGKRIIREELEILKKQKNDEFDQW